MVLEKISKDFGIEIGEKRAAFRGRKKIVLEVEGNPIDSIRICELIKKNSSVYQEFIRWAEQHFESEEFLYVEEDLFNYIMKTAIN